MQTIDLIALLPELVLSAVACLLLLTAFMNEPLASDDNIFYAPRGTELAYKVTLFTLLGLSFAFGLQAVDQPVHAFNGLFMVDALSSLLKSVACLAVLISLIYSKKYLIDRGLFRVDFIVLSLLALLGQCVMISGSNLMTLYLGLELLALPTYALVAMRRDSSISTEAAMKYFILGALASGFLLYGMSMLYGATGSLDLDEIVKAVGDARINRLVLAFAVVFIVSGLAFKLGVAPFHMWVPDVYQGAPTAMTLMIAGAPKLAAFGLLFRLLVGALLPLTQDWQPMIMIMAVLSLVVGNLTAIAQTNVKRMLAYSTISHMGFMILGMLSIFDGNAYSGALFYAVTYVLTTLGSFGLLMILSRQGYECETLDDLKGLNRRNPWLAFMGLVLMFSLAGIPPTVGFAAKLSILETLIDSGHLYLAIIAVMASLVGAFYYLRVVKFMYFDEPVQTAPIEGGGIAKTVFTLNGVFVLLCGIYPATLMALCLTAMTKTLIS
ncbi:NADH-quinone oxidoreductase subunit NuoN [Polynucleobacter sp. MWH-Spelu-300-X4]|jgi:NADH-quinone oxidoreductase subunit N|uniref:NADH-quinone oxidoreductase subunit NuoN n=1 Tax=Polynucleobacter sp. MWH-Spelu-300-X4 TaxID=2689109 RepID=UPI001BFD81C7|nr:NADH-quinone oxidoreductase subunit NuoN [Polynucleobacter sp. MWH-Spelu-300-X4]QWD79298.1 NADH-quinone oxidoreductase subunit NuoN [Polynucleobacter sp. MWH-Spelu-300-X4]